ncbi:extracellular calcium-sensing receptor-like [Protopterus annectens]|uniref:extracellular calcium-sensing receptor-like n=1 Tax=Protopterus annectens TaxID=7888 RepID=UPI001CFC0BD4|nr:extracellular calcium-sensing receptor-like [Protopterus annectens]
MLLGMVFTIEEIHGNLRLLPNITLGFHIFDTCTSIAGALESTMRLLTGQKTTVPNYCCDPFSSAVTVIGDAYSLMSIPMAKLLGLYRHPQISYSASVMALSDKSQFPSFLRTVPSDLYQSIALAYLVLHFGWTWVGILVDSTDYGQQGGQTVKEELIKAGACIEFFQTIPTPLSKMHMQYITEVIRKSTTNVIVVYATDFNIYPIMLEFAKLNVNGKVWIATDSWANSPVFSNKDFFVTLQGTLAFMIRRGEMSGFKEFIYGLNPYKNTEDMFLKIFWELAFDCKLQFLELNGTKSNEGQEAKACTGDENLENIERNFFELDDLRFTYNVYNAIYAVAHALQTMSTCSHGDGPFYNGTCHAIQSFKPWQSIDQHINKIKLTKVKKLERDRAQYLNRTSYSHPPTSQKWNVRGGGVNYGLSVNHTGNEGNREQTVSTHTDCEQASNYDYESPEQNKTVRRSEQLQNQQTRSNFNDNQYNSNNQPLKTPLIRVLPEGNTSTNGNNGRSTTNGEIKYMNVAGFEIRRLYLMKWFKNLYVWANFTIMGIFPLVKTIGGHAIDANLLHYLKDVRFRNKNGEEVYFDMNGDPPALYSILNWQPASDDSFQYSEVGHFKLSADNGKELVIDVNSILWSNGYKQIPQSRCSQSCLAGYRKAPQSGQPICCFSCVMCSQGEISNQSDSITCLKCPSDQWPNVKQDICIQKLTEYLSYEEPLGKILTAVPTFMAVITGTILSVFVKSHNTPVVKANNRELSYVLLLSLVLCFLSSLIFIGRPTHLTCMFRQVSFGIIFTLSVSCVLAKTVVVVIAFNASKPNSNLRKYVGPGLPKSLAALCTLVQVIICVSWVIICPPFQDENRTSVTGKIIIECNEGSPTAFWCMLSYMGLLASVSLVIAFLSRNLPDSFNEAKYITFSMLIFVTVWMSFIPAYFSTQGKYMVAVEVFAIVSSGTGLLVCIFTPKCYIILLRPDMNTRNYLMGKGTHKK